MGSGSSRAQQRANRMERERQATIKTGIANVNSIFDAPERAAQRGDFVSSVRDYYRSQLDRDKSKADRRLKFSMARNGLTGGSAAVDANRTLGEDYTQGLLTADTKAQGAEGDLMAQDEQARLNLMSMIQQGMDATSAAQRASSMVAMNSQNANANAFAGGLGDVFGSTAAIYKKQEEDAARRRGERAVYDALYGNNGRTG